MCYLDIEQKIDVMKQTKSLVSTSVWIVDELTPHLLRNKKKEIDKVKEARRKEFGQFIKV